MPSSCLGASIAAKRHDSSTPLYTDINFKFDNNRQLLCPRMINI